MDALEGKRELLMASAEVSGASGAPVDVQIEASEPGWADLSRLVLRAVNISASPDQDLIDVVPITRIESIRVFNSEELVRGQGDVAAPAGVFDPLRQYNPVALGLWWLEGFNTVSIRLRTTVTTGAPVFDGRFSAAFPFQPQNERTFIVPRLEGRARTYVASPQETLAALTQDLTIEFDQNGVVDLDTLQLLASQDPQAAYSQNVVSAFTIERIQLTTKQDMVIGGGTTLAAPGATFAGLGRRFNWVRMGMLNVSTNNKLVVSVRVPDAGGGAVPATLNGSILTVGAAFYPGKDGR